MADALDFYLVQRLVENKQKQLKEPFKTATFDKLNNVFYYVVLNLLFSLNDNDIDSCITDHSYLESMGRPAGKESGIDAVYIEDKGKHKVVHLLTFKYTEKLNKALESISSSVIDQLLFYVDLLKDFNFEEIPNDYNETLKAFSKRIFEIIAENDVSFVLHLCGNYNMLEKNEKERFETKISKFPLFSIEYDLLDKIVDMYINLGRVSIDGKICLDRGLYFVEHQEEALCSTLIAKVNAPILLKLLSADSVLRNRVKISNEDLKDYQLEEKSFDDNVRIFLGSSKINKKILETASSSSEKHNFYLYNNGITALCKTCKEGLSNKTTFTIEDIQIVNGSQTIHSLADLCKKDFSKIQGIYVLCRFYCINDHSTHSNIAEYTNSQNQVKPRDIKALDKIQIKLEKEFDLLEYKYERKKNQYKSVRGSRLKRLDAERCGQMLVSFYNEDPSTARNNKALIYTTSYDKIFNNSICANKILVVKKFYEYIESRRKENEKIIAANKKYLWHIKYSSYFYLHGIKKVIDKYCTNEKNNDYNVTEEQLKKSYGVVKNLYEVITYEKNSTSPNIDFSDYFKSNNAKTDFLAKLDLLSEKATLDEALSQSKEMLNGIS